jgi:cephalosporin hydroxylase
MTTLLELINNDITDKNTWHSYIDLYEKLLSKKKHTAKNVLEVGIDRGGSIMLWHDYFPSATVYGVDIKDNCMEKNPSLKKERIVLYRGVDAYNEEFFMANFLEKNIKFDIVLDDGPHTLESMQHFLKLYSQVMTDDGILIIEDIQDINWIEELTTSTPDHLKEFIRSYDLRPNKNRYDDIVFTIDKS